MTARVFQAAGIAAVVLMAVLAGLWYFLAAPKAQPAMPGSISGYVTYPSEFTPAQRVCAVRVGGTDADAICVMTEDAPPGATTFKIVNVPPGDYYVYAQLKDPESIGADIAGTLKAYYNEFVLCGLLYSCKDTTPVVVRVTSGVDTPGIMPHDWYH